MRPSAFDFDEDEEPMSDILKVLEEFSTGPMNSATSILYVKLKEAAIEIETLCKAGSSLIHACGRSRAGITDAEYLPAIRYLASAIANAKQTLGDLK